MWRILLLAFAFDGAAFASQAESERSLEQLQPRLWSLAEALRQDLTGDEDAARQRLEEKAAKMSKGDGAAALLRHLAREREEGNDGSQGSQVFSQSSFSESRMASDGQGHGYVLRHVKTCKNGVCEEQTESSHPKDAKDSAHHGASEDGEADVALDREVKKLSRQMQDIEANMNFPKFDDLLAPVSDFWNRFRAFQNPPSKPADQSADQPITHSESMSEETVMRNGHAVRRVRRCKNGKCQMRLEEGNWTNSPSSVLDRDDRGDGRGSDW